MGFIIVIIIDVTKAIECSNNVKLKENFEYFKVLFIFTH